MIIMSKLQRSPLPWTPVRRAGLRLTQICNCNCCGCHHGVICECRQVWKLTASCDCADMSDVHCTSKCFWCSCVTPSHYNKMNYYQGVFNHHRRHLHHWWNTISNLCDQVGEGPDGDVLVSGVGNCQSASILHLISPFKSDHLMVQFKSDHLMIQFKSDQISIQIESSDGTVPIWSSGGTFKVWSSDDHNVSIQIWRNKTKLMRTKSGSSQMQWPGSGFLMSSPKVHFFSQKLKCLP